MHGGRVVIDGGVEILSENIDKFRRNGCKIDHIEFVVSGRETEGLNEVFVIWQRRISPEFFGKGIVFPKRKSPYWSSMVIVKEDHSAFGFIVMGEGTGDIDYVYTPLSDR